ncbi:MAG: rRNA maturation RNase YbeY [Rhizobacter sp.]|nr:rRNA maturation RNase YbeY [Chlorobiales bacterium]
MNRIASDKSKSPATSTGLFISNTTHQILPEKKIRAAIELVLKAEGYRCERISAVYCGDKFIKKINRESLHHDYATDTISFRFNRGKNIDGEFYISLARIKANARSYRVSREEELMRVTIHSVLHLIGYDDRTPKQKKAMTEKENDYLMRSE